LGEASAQVDGDIIDVVAAKIALGTVNATATSVVARDVIAMTVRTTCLTQARAFYVAADGCPTTTNDAVAFAALTVPRAGVTKSLLARDNAFTLAIATASSLRAYRPDRRVRRLAVRQRATEPQGFAIRGECA
jgi:hypothetical protein